MSPQQPVEMILLRQLASYVNLPTWMMDGEGNLVYYNEPAESLLGVRFDDVGPLRAERLADMFQTTDLDGHALEGNDLPVVSALVNRRPVHGEIRFCGFDGVWHEIEVSALPIEGPAGRFVGVVATFWELER